MGNSNSNSAYNNSIKSQLGSIPATDTAAAKGSVPAVLENELGSLVHTPLGLGRLLSIKPRSDGFYIVYLLWGATAYYHESVLLPICQLVQSSCGYGLLQPNKSINNNIIESNNLIKSEFPDYSYLGKFDWGYSIFDPNSDSVNKIEDYSIAHLPLNTCLGRGELTGKARLDGILTINLDCGGKLYTPVDNVELLVQGHN